MVLITTNDQLLNIQSEISALTENDIICNVYNGNENSGIPIAAFTVLKNLKANIEFIDGKNNLQEIVIYLAGYYRGLGIPFRINIPKDVMSLPRFVFDAKAFNPPVAENSGDKKSLAPKNDKTSVQRSEPETKKDFRNESKNKVENKEAGSNTESSKEDVKTNHDTKPSELKEPADTKIKNDNEISNENKKSENQQKAEDISKVGSNDSNTSKSKMEHVNPNLGDEEEFITEEEQDDDKEEFNEFGLPILDSKKESSKKFLDDDEDETFFLDGDDDFDEEDDDEDTLEFSDDDDDEDFPSIKKNTAKNELKFDDNDKDEEDEEDERKDAVKEVKEDNKEIKKESQRPNNNSDDSELAFDFPDKFLAELKADLSGISPELLNYFNPLVNAFYQTVESGIPIKAAFKNHFNEEDNQKVFDLLGPKKFEYLERFKDFV